MIWLAFFLLAPFFAQAQDIHFGTKLGLNLANFSTDLESQSAVGWHGGVFFALEIGKIGVRPELLYSVKGGETTLNFTTPTLPDVIEVSQDISLRYIDVPVLFEYSVLPFLRLQAGPQISMLLTDQTTFAISGTGFDDIEQTLEDNVNYEDLDVGLALGVGANFSMFDVGLRYTLGFAKVSELEAATNINDLRQYDLRNNVFQVSVGYRFK